MEEFPNIMVHNRPIYITLSMPSSSSVPLSEDVYIILYTGLRFIFGRLLPGTTALGVNQTIISFLTNYHTAWNPDH